MRNARTLKDIVDHPMVESTHTEWDGCFEDSLGRELQGRWVYLKTGFICEEMECGTIHEPSIKACCEKLNGSRRMTREEMDTAGYNADMRHEALLNWSKAGLVSFKDAVAMVELTDFNQRWNLSDDEFPTKAPTTFFRDGTLMVSGEDGDDACDYYGEFRGGYPHINPRLESVAKAHGMMWEWINAGMIGAYEA